MIDSDKPDLTRLIALQQLLMTFGNVQRVVHYKDTTGQYVSENDIEHSYSLTMLAWYLSGYFAELDQNTILRLALAHDLVEIYAGDTYIYGDATHIATKADREAAALSKLANEWPDFTDIIDVMRQYNERATAEAKFVYALDKLQPIFLIYINNGYSWHKNNVTVAMLDEHKRNKAALSPEIFPYYEQLYQLLIESPDIIRPK